MTVHTSELFGVLSGDSVAKIAHRAKALTADYWERNSHVRLVTLSVVAALQIVKRCKFAMKRKLYCGHCAVTVLTNDNFGNSLFFGILVVDLVSVNKQNQVGVLLDRTRFAEVRGLWSLVTVTGLQTAVQLRERDHGTLHFFRQRFKAPTDDTDFAFSRSVLRHRSCRHQLKVVDDDEIEVTLFAFHLSATGLQVHDADARRIVEHEVIGTKTRNFGIEAIEFVC